MQVKTRRAEFTVDVPFVFMNENRAIGLHVVDFFLQATQHFRAPLGKSFVIAEDADERRIEEFRQFHRQFEPFKMRVERLAEFDLPDGRTDGDHSQAVVVELLFDFRAQRFVKIEHVPARHAAQFKMRHALLLAFRDLHVEVRGDLVAEGG
jgi:hypothetical protein